MIMKLRWHSASLFPSFPLTFLLCTSHACCLHFALAPPLDSLEGSCALTARKESLCAPRRCLGKEAA